MDIYVIYIGEYEDTRVYGVATSPEKKDLLMDAAAKQFPIMAKDELISWNKYKTDGYFEDKKWIAL